MRCGESHVLAYHKHITPRPPKRQRIRRGEAQGSGRFTDVTEDVGLWDHGVYLPTSLRRKGISLRWV